MATFDPYHQWLSIPANEQPPHHYRLLGVALFENDADVIDSAADRQMSYLKKCETGPHLKECQKLLNELSAARVCLLNPAKKAAYDASLKEKIAAAPAGDTRENVATAAAAETPKKPPTSPGSLRKQAEKLLADHEYSRAQKLLGEMAASTVSAEQADAVWARQQMETAKAGDENMRRQAESAIQYSRKLIQSHEYSDAIRLLEQFPAKFRSAQMTELLAEATSLQQEVDLLQSDIERFIAQRDFVSLKAAAERFRQLKPGNARIKQLCADINTYGNKPVIYLAPDERNVHSASLSGGFSTGQIIGGGAILSLLFGATLFATYFYVANSKHGIEKSPAQVEESTWKVEIQIDNSNAKVTIDGRPIELTGKLTRIFLLPGRHEWTAMVSAGETKSGHFEVSKMEVTPLVIATGSAPSAAGPPSDRSENSWNTIEFQTWLRDVSAMNAEQQVAAVSKRLIERNPGFDGQLTGAAGKTSPPDIQDGIVKKLRLITDHVTDISPVRALTGLEVLICTGEAWNTGKLTDLSPLAGLKLQVLDCGWSPLFADLSPLRGMPLTHFACHNTSVADLSPLKGMPIEDLGISGTKVSDLSPLVGMPLNSLYCRQTNVVDLTPLAGLPLVMLGCDLTEVSDLTPLKNLKLKRLLLFPEKIKRGLDQIRQMPTLVKIGIGWKDNEQWPAAEFWRKYDAGEFGKPIPFGSDSPLKPWMKEIAALPVGQQIGAVVNKLRELNPGFDGKVAHQIEDGVIASLEFNTDNIKTIEPVRALVGLQNLNAMGSEVNFVPQGQLTDLSPLIGLQLKTLNFSRNPIDNLMPLQGMKLKSLACYSTKVADLSPLNGMPLESLACYVTNISDLSPLRGMPLESLATGASSVSDLSPLRGMPLTYLAVRDTKVRDLSPLVGMPLTRLYLDGTEVTDLTPLKDMKLTEMLITPSKINKGLDLVRQIPSLTTIGVGVQESQRWPAAEFWKKYDGGEFNKRESSAPDRKPITNVNDPAFQKWLKGTVTLPAKKQLEAVAKKLQALNPGFDGKLTPKIESGAVIDLEVSTDQINDIAPLRAFLKLVSLRAIGSLKDGAIQGKLDDLTPLVGAKLRYLTCSMNPVSDLSPLKDMPLIALKIDFTQVSNLSPLQGMKLKDLTCNNNLGLADLSPLKGVPLETLTCYTTKISDLSPLRGLPLKMINCGFTAVVDLSPLKGIELNYLDIRGTKVDNLESLVGMPLNKFHCDMSDVTDLTPIKAMKLTELMLTPSKIKIGMDAMRQMSSLTQIGIGWRDTEVWPAAEFWKKYDAREFK